MIKKDTCAVCRAHAGSGHGFGHRHQPMIWACSDKSCIASLPKVYAMSRDTLDAYDFKAIKEAGDKAGLFLNDTGANSFDELTFPQWEEFMAVAITSYQDSIRRMIANDEAPF